ncbi:hypothetical protein C8T65DRAFT_709696 [Cerioporus squamosus]|nr:hypothetical protein C8T65DRAFT_709696 [Cerioporus squamosus]
MASWLGRCRKEFPRSAWPRVANKCAEPREDEEFWFDDGTIVLVAGNIKFRVYRGILTEHSPFFAETLSLPQPTECQGVHDNPESLRHVFRLLMPRKTANFAAVGSPMFDMVSAYIRIAHKYQMEALLSHWLDWISHQSMVPDGFEPIHAIGVVNLARLTGCTSILPTALAVCTTLGDKIVTGFTRDDDTHKQLSMADLGRCFRAKGFLIQANATAVALALAPEDTSDRFCFPNAKGRCTEVSFLAPEGLMPSWRTYDEAFKSEYAVCRHCLAMRQNNYQEAQRVTWRRLPEFTGVRVDD